MASSKPLIVIDAQNIAMKHGRDKVFSVKGI
jgi:Ni,Fe-hydrogenase maturation factor